MTAKTNAILEIDLRALAAAAALGLGLHGAALGAPVVLYQNNFESPATTDCPNFKNNAKYGVLPAEYGTNFIQLETPDRLCLNGTDPAAAPADDRFADPSGQAGKYFVGFYGAPRLERTEAFGMALDLTGIQQVNGTVQLSHVRLAGYDDHLTSPSIGSPVSVTLNYYRLPADQTSFAFSQPAAMEDPAPVHSVPSGTALTPIKTDTVSVTNTNTDPKSLAWMTHPISADISGFAPGDKLIIAFTGLAWNEYMAVDNLRIMGEDGQPTPVPVNAWWALLLAGLGIGWLGRRRAR